MTMLMHLLYGLAGLVVLAEALNKLERTDIFEGAGLRARLRGLAWLLTPWRWRRQRVVIALKLTAWMLLAIGAAGAIVAPLRDPHPPSVQSVLVMAGFALLVVRSRLKEG